MKKFLVSSSVVAAAIMFAGSANAATNINAAGSGWCNNGSTCNSTNLNTINNTFAGILGSDEYRNWFNFSIPAGVITSASISIWNNGNNYTSQPSAIYSLRRASTISFSALNNGGTVLGSVSAGAADTGVSHYETIVLNAAGIAALNSAAGGSFLFGGSSNATGPSQMFGYTGGSPLAYLSLTTGPGVPEPATWALLIAGFGMVGGAMRRRQTVSVTYA